MADQSAAVFAADEFESIFSNFIWQNINSGAYFMQVY
jgi:hypothetical protein